MGAKGTKNVLPYGAVKAIKALRHAEEEDPEAKEGLGVVLAVMRGEIKGRHVGTRLKAALEYRHDRVGKPLQRTHITGSLTLADLVNASMKEPGDE